MPIFSNFASPRSSETITSPLAHRKAIARPALVAQNSVGKEHRCGELVHPGDPAGTGKQSGYSPRRIAIRSDSSRPVQTSRRASASSPL